MRQRRTVGVILVTGAAAFALIAVQACGREEPSNVVRASGYVEATDVQLAAEVGGRVMEVRVAEGDRVETGRVIAKLDTRDTELAIRRADAERRQVDAQLRLLRAGARVEDIRQAETQVAAADAELAAAREDLEAAEHDLERYERLLRNNAGSEKQRDDAATRRDVTRERVRAAEQHLQGAREALARLRAGARREEIAAAEARVAAVDAQLATLDKQLADATVTSPLAGIVTEKIVDAGEIVAPRAPIVVIADLDHAWAEVFVDEPLVPRIRLGQDATLFTDAGGPGVQGKVSFISPKAEFTPRNVQTADERAKLVYRLKVAIDNKNGVFKQGMPVEAEIPLTPQS
jgi:HlyD family secretion protein